jgi:hypothetical protein
MQVLGDDVQCPARSERPAEHRPRNVVEGPARPGVDGDDLRQDAQIDAGLGSDEQSFERGDEVRVAQVLRHQLGDTPGPCLADVEDVAPHAREQRPVRGEGGGVTARHDCHSGRAAAHRRIQIPTPRSRHAWAMRRITLGALVVMSM